MSDIKNLIEKFNIKNSEDCKNLKKKELAQFFFEFLKISNLKLEDHIQRDFEWIPHNTLVKVVFQIMDKEIVANMPVAPIEPPKTDKVAYNEYLEKLDEIGLIIVYRKEQNERQRDLLFLRILHKKDKNGKTWDIKIKNHIRKNRFKIDMFANQITEKDIYQETLINFHNTIKTHFDVKMGFKFSTYVWYAIINTIHRISQEYNYDKRKIPVKDIIRFGSTFDDGSKKWDEVISTESVGGKYSIKNRKISFVDKFALRSLIDHLKDTLKPSDLGMDKNIYKDIKNLINNKECNYKNFKIVTTRYDIKLKDFFILKEKVLDEIKKEMFLDLIKNIENGVDDGILSTKFKCSKSQITNMKTKLNEYLKKEVEKLNLSVNDIFN